jgi:hypothetical protein
VVVGSASQLSSAALVVYYFLCWGLDCIERVVWSTRVFIMTGLVVLLPLVTPIWEVERWARLRGLA